MKVQNPQTDRPILANVYGQWYEIPAGEAIDVEDAAVATSLREYGATIAPAELEAALAVHADTNREINSRTASASASEGSILGRQQRTVSVANGGVDGGPLRGAALEAAVAEANEAGAEIKVSGSVAERQAALAEWQTRQGPSSPVHLEGDEFEISSTGELVLDEEGQPIPKGTDAYLRDENGGLVVSEDGSPVAVPQDEDEGGAASTPPATDLGVDDAGTGSED